MNEQTKENQRASDNLNSLVRSELLDCFALFSLDDGWTRTAENDIDRGLLQLGINLGLVDDVSPMRGTYHETFILNTNGRMFLRSND